MNEPAPSAVETLLGQAAEQLSDGRLDEAVATFSSVLAMAPQEVAALRGRGVAYGQLKRWVDAAADFLAARDLKPEDWDIWVDLAISLATEHQMYPAIDVLDTLLAKQPDFVRGRIELGLLHLRLGAIPKGCQELQRALASRPSPAQRQLIQSVLHEQERLDKKRIYRPDFEQLHQQSGPALEGIRTLWRRLFKKG